MYFSFILRLFFSPLTHLLFICLFCMFFVFFYLFNFSLFFLCRSLDFPAHPKTQNKTKNPNSKLQNPDQKASKPVCPTRVCPTSVCPPVCPTASSPKAQTFEPPLTIRCVKKIGLFAPYFFIFFPVIKAAVFYMEFWFMTGLPQESRQFFVFANSSAQWAKCHAGNHQKSVQSLAHKQFVSQKSGTTKKMDGENVARVPPRGSLPLW